MTAIRVNVTASAGTVVSAVMQRRAGIDIETGREIWEDDPNYKTYFKGTQIWSEYVSSYPVQKVTRIGLPARRKRSFKRARIAQKKAGLL